MCVGGRRGERREGGVCRGAGEERGGRGVCVGGRRGERREGGVCRGAGEEGGGCV